MLPGLRILFERHVHIHAKSILLRWILLRPWLWRLWAHLSRWSWSQSFLAWMPPLLGLGRSSLLTRLVWVPVSPHSLIVVWGAWKMVQLVIILWDHAPDRRVIGAISWPAPALQIIILLLHLLQFLLKSLLFFQVLLILYSSLLSLSHLPLLLRDNLRFVWALI